MHYTVVVNVDVALIDSTTAQNVHWVPEATRLSRLPRMESVVGAARVRGLMRLLELLGARRCDSIVI